MHLTTWMGSDGGGSTQMIPLSGYFTRRTNKPAYPSGWTYALHYGAREPDPPRTRPDGTIRRYDNAHEDTKGHELHVPGEPTQIIQFPGMVALWQRFWDEIPKSAFDLTA